MRWSKADFEKLKELYPDFASMRAAFPDRSIASIRHKVRTLRLPALVRKFSAAEDELIFQHYPDYTRLQQIMPDRSLASIYTRTRKLDIQQRAWWSAAARTKLIKLLNCGATPREIRSHFPDRTLLALEKQAYKCGIRWPSRIETKSRFPIVQDIRERCASQGVGLGALAHAVKARDFLSESHLREDGMSYRAVGEAVSLLGGELYAEWED